MHLLFLALVWSFPHHIEHFQGGGAASGNTLAGSQVIKRIGLEVLLKKPIAGNVVSVVNPALFSLGIKDLNIRKLEDDHIHIPVVKPLARMTGRGLNLCWMKKKKN